MTRLLDVFSNHRRYNICSSSRVNLPRQVERVHGAPKRSHSSDWCDRGSKRPRLRVRDGTLLVLPERPLFLPPKGTYSKVCIFIDETLNVHLVLDKDDMKRLDRGISELDLGSSELDDTDHEELLKFMERFKLLVHFSYWPPVILANRLQHKQRPGHTDRLIEMMSANYLKLKSLYINAYFASFQSLAQLANLRDLRTLAIYLPWDSFDNDENTGSLIKLFGRLSRLTSIELTYCPNSYGEGACHLARLERFRRFLEAIAVNCTRLEELDTQVSFLNDTDDQFMFLDDQCVDIIKRMSNLERLDLLHANIEPMKQVEMVENLPKLRVLKMNFARKPIALKVVQCLNERAAFDEDGRWDSYILHVEGSPLDFKVDKALGKMSPNLEYSFESCEAAQERHVVLFANGNLGPIPEDEIGQITQL